MTRLLAHQQRVYDMSRDKRAFGVFWEPGLGKTALTVWNACHLYERGRIDSVIILAPKSVYKNWVHETKKFAWPAIKYDVMAYPRKRDVDVTMRFWLDRTMMTDRLRIMPVSYDIMKSHGRDILQYLCDTFRTLIVADESTVLKHARADVTKTAKKLAAKCSYKRILTGTPITNSPFDIHSQLEFLDKNFWARHGMRSMSAFKARYGQFSIGYNGDKRYKKISGYNNLGELSQIIAGVSDRLLKDDSGIEFPPKHYEMRTFELTTKVRKAYETLRSEYALEMSGGYVETPMAMSRIQKLMQITSGYVRAFESFDDMLDPESAPKPVRLISDDDNPRMHLLKEIIWENRDEGKIIVFCTQREEVDGIMRCVPGCVRYDGKTSNREREISVQRFMDETDTDARILVANQASLSHGLTLIVANVVVHYSNLFSLERRLQSDDRVHRIGQTRPVKIIDIVAEYTVEERVREVLIDRHETAAIVNGDTIRKWINE